MYRITLFSVVLVLSQAMMSSACCCFSPCGPAKSDSGLAIKLGVDSNRPSGGCCCGCYTPCCCKEDPALKVRLGTETVYKPTLVPSCCGGCCCVHKPESALAIKLGLPSDDCSSTGGCGCGCGCDCGCGCCCSKPNSGLKIKLGLGSEGCCKCRCC